MKKLLPIIITLGVIALMQSCKPNYFKITGEGQMNAFNYGKGNFYLGEIDTIAAPFTLFAQFKQVFVASSLNFNLVSTAYATTKLKIYQNHIDSASFKLTLDKPFTYNGTTIAAGDNLMNIDSVKTRIYTEYAHLYFDFPQSFIDNAVFTKDNYKFILTGMTDDHIALRLERALYFDL